MQKFENYDHVLPEFKTVNVLDDVFSSFIIGISLFFLQRS